MKRLATTLIIGALAAATPVVAQPGDPAMRSIARVPVLAVSATGGVDVPADQVEIRLSVVSEAKSADEALTANEGKVGAVMSALLELALEGEELSTSNFSINPMYDHRDRGQPFIVGYTVTNAVQVRTKKLDMSGKIIQAAVNAGANNVEYVAFGLSGKQGRDEAIARAAASARRDAQTLASAAGVTLGRVLHVSLAQDQHWPMQRMARLEFAGAADGGAPEPSLTPGAVRVSATVTMEFEISE